MKRIVFVAVFSLFFASFYTYGQELVGSYWNGKYGFKDKKTGTIVVSHKYDWASWNFHEGLAAVRLKRKFGFINYNGTVAIPIRYDAALNFSEGLASVKLKGKYGFIDRTGAVVIHFNYDDAKQFSEGLAAIKQNGKYGFIDKTGNIVIPCIYDIAEKFSEGKTAVKLNGRWGFIDKTGAVVIPIAYASMFAAEDWKSNKAIAGVNTTSVARNTNTNNTNVSPQASKNLKETRSNTKTNEDTESKPDLKNKVGVQAGVNFSTLSGWLRTENMVNKPGIQLGLLTEYYFKNPKFGIKIDLLFFQTGFKMEEKYTRFDQSQIKEVATANVNLSLSRGHLQFKNSFNDVALILHAGINIGYLISANSKYEMFIDGKKVRSEGELVLKDISSSGNAEYGVGIGAAIMLKNKFMVGVGYDAGLIFSNTSATLSYMFGK